MDVGRNDYVVCWSQPRKRELRSALQVHDVNHGVTMYIAIDGPNFSGKTSTVSRLSDYFSSQGSEVRVLNGVRSDHALGELIHRPDRLYKNSPITNSLLIAAEKFFTYYSVVRPALSRGEIVISDRYLMSCLAYGFLYDLDLKWLWTMYRDLPKADKIIYLRTSVYTLEQRMAERNDLSYSEKKFTRRAEHLAFEEAAKFLLDQCFPLVVVEEKYQNRDVSTFL